MKKGFGLKNKRVHYQTFQRNGIRCVVDGTIIGNNVKKNVITINTKLNADLKVARLVLLDMIDKGVAVLTKRKGI